MRYSELIRYRSTFRILRGRFPTSLETAAYFAEPVATTEPCSMRREFADPRPRPEVMRGVSPVFGNNCAENCAGLLKTRPAHSAFGILTTPG